VPTRDAAPLAGKAAEEAIALDAEPASEDSIAVASLELRERRVVVQVKLHHYL
jgi:hypothetical protein